MLAAYVTAAGVLTLLAIVPGPDVAVVTRVAVLSGRAAGGRAALGVVLGLAVWGALTVLGLAAVLAASSRLYTAVKVAGAAYLMVLGVSAIWRSRAEAVAPPPAVRGESPGRPLRMGLTTNLLNPKIAVFYTSALPALVPHGGSPALWLALLVATHAAVTLCVLSCYAAFFSARRAMLTSPRVRRLLDRLTGVALIAFGVRIASEVG
jgi:threonine/homoserine/homoserine lactone efflux protein